MPAVSYDSMAAWSNYHLTLGEAAPPYAIPSVIIESLGRFHAADASELDGLERFSATGSALLKHLTKLAGMLNPAAPAQPRSFAAGLVGRGWSFSPLIGSPVSTLLCDGLAGTSTLNPTDWNSGCSVPYDRIALTSGGTRLRELVNWAERRNLTVATSGTHLGPTIAGGACTASHGSRLGYGGLQNMVLGMHLIVGDREHVWIERRSSPVLSEAGRRRLDIPGAVLRHVCDDDVFEDALIHLGCMGIVNGVAVELVHNDVFALMRRRAALDATWLEEIGRGDHGRTAARLQCSVPPIFHEVTISPRAPFAEEAAHIMYFPRTTAPLLPPGTAENIRPADAIGRMGSLLLGGGASPVPREELSGSRFGGNDDNKVVKTLKLLLGHESVFAYYRAIGGFEPNAGKFDPDDIARPGFYWSGLHDDEITGNTPGALYNASFAIPLERVAVAVPAICEAVSALAPSFVFTLRFVSRAAGTLAFTRFTDCAVIEIDGLSPLICRLAAAGLDPGHPGFEDLRAGLAILEGTLPKGAAAVRRALDEAGIPYSLHWAKLGDLDRAKVYADYGHPAEPESSLVRRWRETRSALLTNLGRQLFWNEAAVHYGLVEPNPPASATTARHDLKVGPPDRDHSHVRQC
jgi:hypothetical protein